MRWPPGLGGDGSPGLKGEVAPGLGGEGSSGSRVRWPPTGDGQEASPALGLSQL